MDPDEDLILEGDALRAEGPCIEEGVGRVHVPTKGKLFADDGTVQVAIIRPCVSRGKRLRGLPPIYEPSMLGRNAGVFESWHMWMGHLTEAMRESIEEMEELLREAALNRNIARDLGGRVLETWFDPEYRGKDDDSLGYRPGSVMGRVIPYPASRAILECDPEGLHVSIAAWPTSAKKAVASWDPKAAGMAIEGFRRTPQGSVDWVLRGGAGGRVDERVLRETEALAVSALGTLYSPGRIKSEEQNQMDLTKITKEQLLETLREQNPGLAAQFAAPAPAPVVAQTPVGVSVDDVSRIVQEAVTKATTDLTATFTTKLEEAESAVEERAQEIVGERDGFRLLEKAAHTQIKAAGFGEKVTEDLKSRYMVLPSGPTPALLVEAAGDKSVEDVLREKVEADIVYVRGLLEEATSRPRVTGLGGGGGGAPAQPQGRNLIREFLQEGSGSAEPLKDEDIKTLVQEGVA